ncbi:MAG: hypothetical protein NXI00_04610 [Cytophagales bacterium]|nr:hypothetical protein [Cytophagales bacterium]
MENSNKNNSGVKTGVMSVVLGVALAAAGIVGAYQYQNAQEAHESLAVSEQRANELNEKRAHLANEVSSLSAELERKIKESEETAAALKAMEEAEAKRKTYSYKANNERRALLERQKMREQEIDSLQNQLLELNVIKDQMTEELKVIPVLEEENANLKKEIASWESKYAALEADFKDLNERYRQVIYDAPADNFRIEVLDKKGKLTSRAKKAEFVNISFLMPEFLQKEMKGKEMLYLSLFDEKIKPLDGFEKEMKINSLNSSIPVAVHATQSIDAATAPQLVTFKVALQQDLEPGFYKGKVYSQNNYYGTVDFRLR